MLIFLFGGWARTGNLYGRPCRMRFLTHRGAVSYGSKGLSAIDPYARFLTGPIVAIPGKWARKDLGK